MSNLRCKFNWGSWSNKAKKSNGVSLDGKSTAEKRPLTDLSLP